MPPPQVCYPPHCLKNLPPSLCIAADSALPPPFSRSSYVSVETQAPEAFSPGAKSPSSDLRSSGGRFEGTVAAWPPIDRSADENCCDFVLLMCVYGLIHVIKWILLSS